MEKLSTKVANKDIEQLLTDAEAHFENALDDMYYGYDYDFWRNHYGCDKDLSERDARIVWETAKWVMSEDYCEGMSQYPTLRTAYMWKEDGCPDLEPDTANEVYSTAQDIIDNFKPKAVRFGRDNETVLIRDEYSGLEFWVDSWLNERSHDVNFNWNEGTFITTNDIDVLRKLIQDDCWVFMLATEEALYFQEKHGVFVEMGNGEWRKADEVAIAN